MRFDECVSTSSFNVCDERWNLCASCTLSCLSVVNAKMNCLKWRIQLDNDTEWLQHEFVRIVLCILVQSLESPSVEIHKMRRNRNELCRMNWNYYYFHHIHTAIYVWFYCAFGSNWGTLTNDWTIFKHAEWINCLIWGSSQMEKNKEMRSLQAFANPLLFFIDFITLNWSPMNRNWIFDWIAFQRATHWIIIQMLMEHIGGAVQDFAVIW